MSFADQVGEKQRATILEQLQNFFRFVTEFREGELRAGRSGPREPQPIRKIIALEESQGAGAKRRERARSLAVRRCEPCPAEPPGEAGGAEFKQVPPHLEGIKIDNRWVIVYSKYDVGCALEKHQTTDCLGHDHDSAKLLARAVVLYALRR